MGGLLRIADFLHHIPMFLRFANFAFEMT